MRAYVRNMAQLRVALKRFRKEKNLTQAKLASDANLRQATISKVESGAETIQLTTIFNLLRALGLEIVIQPKSEISFQHYVDSQ